MAKKAIEPVNDFGHPSLIQTGKTWSNQSSTDKYKQMKIDDCLDLNSGQIIASLYGAVQCLIKKVEALESL